MDASPGGGERENKEGLGERHHRGLNKQTTDTVTVYSVGRRNGRSHAPFIRVSKKTGHLSGEPLGCQPGRR